MEFWGVEVKAGKPLTVTPEMGKLVHISQAALGEGKREKGSDIIPIRVKINDAKYVLGSLSAENFPQISFDLVFEKEFELSHDWKNGSVYFCGYIADQVSEDEFESEDDEEEILLPVTENGKVEPKAQEVKPDAVKVKAAKPESSAKPKVTLVEPKKDESESDDDSGDSLDDDDDDDMLDVDSDDISGSIDDDDDDDSEDDDDDSDDSDEETPTPKKPLDKLEKKRPNGSASKTPVPAKKSKMDSAQKTDGKKGGHVATPHPSKKAEKSPATSKQTPKSDAKISCNSCPKKFTSDGALQSHTKAKHAAAK